MIINKLKQELRSFNRVLQGMRQSPVLFSSFIALSVLAALTEGLTVSLLIPILDAQSMGNSFSSIPVLGYVSRYFDGVGGSEKLTLAAIFLLVVVLFRGALQMAVMTVSILIPIQVQRRLTMTGYKHMLSVGMGYINNHDIGDHLNNIKERPSRISKLLIATAHAISLFLILVIYTVMMLLISWKLTIIAVVVLGFFSWCLKLLNEGPIAVLGNRTSGALADLNQALYETLEGMQLIRLRAAERKSIIRFSKTFEENLQIDRKRGILYALPGPALLTAVGGFVCVLLFYTASLADAGTQDVTSRLILFLFLLMRLLSPITGLNTSRRQFIGNIAALDEVDNFIAEVQKHIPKNGEIIFEKVHSSIDFKNVYFHYDNENEQVIRGFSAEIPKNNTVAIVGPSGAGKSTIVNLLGRLYDPQEGRILVDGVDLRDFDVSTWRRRISIVSQDIVLFNDTVANNIAFGEDSTTRHKIVSASKLASANTFIEELPDGYDTMLGDRGVRLSGGQKQRIAIARAFLCEPDVLIIDEGTSHLDSVTEYEIQKAVASLSQNRTVMIIAHRLSTIKNANKILVMENGRIVENGSHNELIELQGNYWNLLNHQKLDLFDGSHSISLTSDNP